MKDRLLFACSGQMHACVCVCVNEGLLDDDEGTQDKEHISQMTRSKSDSLVDPFVSLCLTSLSTWLLSFLDNH